MGLDKSLTGHDLECPRCQSHLTSLLLCPNCGIRFTATTQIDLVEEYRKMWASWQGWEDVSVPGDFTCSICGGYTDTDRDHPSCRESQAYQNEHPEEQ
jgi:hypothetical protein